MLASCALLSERPPPPIEQPEPVAVDPRICAPAEGEPGMPDAATIVAAANQEEASAMALFLTYVQGVIAWGRAGWERADLARGAVCLEDKSRLD